MKVATVAVFAAGLCISAAGLFLSRPPYLRAQTQQVIGINRRNRSRTRFAVFADCRMM